MLRINNNLYKIKFIFCIIFLFIIQVNCYQKIQNRGGKEEISYTFIDHGNENNYNNHNIDYSTPQIEHKEDTCCHKKKVIIKKVPQIIIKKVPVPVIKKVPVVKVMKIVKKVPIPVHYHHVVEKKKEKKKKKPKKKKPKKKSKFITFHFISFCY